MKNETLYIFLSGFLSGVLLRSFWNFGLAFGIFLMLLGLAVLIYGKISERPARALPLPALSVSLIALFIFSFGLGVFRFDLADAPPDQLIESNVGRNVAVEGIIDEDPDYRENNVHFVLNAEKIILPEKETAVSGKILLLASLYPEFKYGDKIRAEGLLQKPKNFAGEDGRDFDYISYLRKDGINFEIFSPKINFLSGGNGNILKSGLFSLKNSFMENLRKFIPEPEVSLLGGLVVGAKSSLGKELLEDFRKVGLIHVVVLSGYNITIIADFITKIFFFVPLLFQRIFSIMSIILFAIMVGGGATVIRASIMAILVIWAKSGGKSHIITRALLYAGFLMIAHNPLILVFDSSFQLSFLATVGLIYVSPLIEKHLLFVTEKWKIREIIVSTLATQIFVLPFLLYKMGIFSVVALPVNLLVLAFIPATMLLGFLGGIAGFIWSVLSAPFAWGAHAFLFYELSAVKWFASFSFSSFAVPQFSFSFVILIYILYAYFLRKIRQRKNSFEDIETRKNKIQPV